LALISGNSAVNSAVARIGGKEHPFGFLDKLISGPVQVGLFKFQRLDVPSSAIFQVARWRVRFGLLLSFPVKAFKINANRD